MSSRHFPDGLTESLIDTLITECYAAVQPVRRPTSPFATPSDVRRLRRETNRTLAQVVRLPLSPVTATDGRAA